MDSSGRFYLLERPNPQDVQDRLWMMVLLATKARDEMKEQLKRKVEELVRKEAALLDWQHNLDVRERKLDDGDEGLPIKIWKTMGTVVSASEFDKFTKV